MPVLLHRRGAAQKDIATTSAQVEVEFKSFELDLAAPREVVSSTQDRFAEKYGLTYYEARARIEEISDMGRAEGLDFKYLT